MNEIKEESSWLSMLKMELAMISTDQILDPETEFESEENETFVGTATLEIRKMWTYFLHLEEKATRLLVDARFSKKVAERETLLKHSYELKAKAELVHSILFLSLRDMFSIWNPTLGLGIRAGWKVVTFKSKTSSFLDFLKGEL